MNRTEKILDTDRGYHISCLDGSAADQRAMILCLHGFAGSKRSLMIERLHNVMAERRSGTFTFDWPGHGESDAPSSKLTLENCMKDLKEAREYAAGKYGVPVWCFATSFGGYLAMLYHQKEPEVFDKIMLRSPALRMAMVMKSAMKEEKLNRFMSGEAVDFGHDRPLLLNRAVYDELCRNDVFEMPPAYPERIRIIHGDSDEMVPCEHSREYAEKYGITLHFCRGAGHEYDHPGDAEWVMKEAVDFFAADDAGSES